MYNASSSLDHYTLVLSYRVNTVRSAERCEEATGHQVFMRQFMLGFLVTYTKLPTCSLDGVNLYVKHRIFVMPWIQLKHAKADACRNPVLNLER